MSLKKSDEPVMMRDKFMEAIEREQEPYKGCHDAAKCFYLPLDYLFIVSLHRCIISG